MSKKQQLRALRKRRRAVSRLCRRGWTQAEIAARLNVDRSTISRDLQVLGDEIRKATQRDLQAMFDLQISHIAALEQELWQAWEDSRKPVVRPRAGRDPESDGVSLHSPLTERKEAGDPLYMLLYQECFVHRLALWNRGAKGTVRGAEGDESEIGPRVPLERIEAVVRKILAKRLADLERQTSLDRLPGEDGADWETYPTVSTAPLDYADEYAGLESGTAGNPSFAKLDSAGEEISQLLASLEEECRSLGIQEPGLQSPDTLPEPPASQLPTEGAEICVQECAPALLANSLQATVVQ